MSYKSSSSSLTSSSTSSKLPIPTADSELSFSAITTLNETTSEWQVNHLPSNITIQSNGTIILLKSNDTTTLTRMNSSSVGSVPLIPFIYLIMSILIIIFMILPSSRFIIALTSSKLHKYEPILSPTKLTERRFARRLQIPYPSTSQGTRGVISQAETVSRTGETGSQDVRECGELIRGKFGLDIEIWNLRDVTLVNRPVVKDMMRRSEDAMDDVRRVVGGWQERRGEWSAEEWEVVREIGERVGGLKRG